MSTNRDLDPRCGTCQFWRDPPGMAQQRLANIGSGPKQKVCYGLPPTPNVIIASPGPGMPPSPQIIVSRCSVAADDIACSLHQDHNRTPLHLNS